MMMEGVGHMVVSLMKLAVLAAFGYFIYMKWDVISEIFF